MESGQLHSPVALPPRKEIQSRTGRSNKGTHIYRQWESNSIAR